MKHLLSLSPRGSGGALRVVVETPRGSAAKLKLDSEVGAFTLVRPLPLGLKYPFDWGFVPGTRAPDGDPLDALVLHDGATFPGVVVDAQAVAVLQLEQNAAGGGRERNDRLVVVPVADERRTAARDVTDLDPRTRAELEHFFAAAVAFADKDVALLGWGDAAAAEHLVAACIAAP